MALGFQPKTEEQLQQESLIAAGEYDFEVLEATDTTSKKGNAMIKVNLGIYSGEAIRYRVFDYLLESMGAKLRHFCDTTGLLTNYEQGTLCAQDCRGRAGKVRLQVDEAKDGYPPKNSVKDYVVRKTKPIAQKPTSINPPGVAEDDVPF